MAAGGMGPVGHSVGSLERQWERSLGSAAPESARTRTGK